MLRLYISDGTTTIDLNLGGSGGNFVTEFVPRVPAGSVARMFEVQRVTIGGSSVSARSIIDDQIIIEQARVIFGGGNLAQGRASIQSLNKLFMQATVFNEQRVGAPVYVYFQPNGDAATYRSLLNTGRVELDRAAMDSGWFSGRVGAVVIWQRQMWWEDATEIQLNMSNDVTSSTNTITLYNSSNNAAGRNNFVRISGIGGDVPGPVRFEITNNYASATRMSDMIIGHCLDNGNALAHIIEGETFTPYGASSVQTNAAASGGQTLRLAWSSGSSEIAMCDVTISSAQLNALAGLWVRILACFTSGATLANTRLRARVTIEQLTPVFEGSFVAMPTSSDIVDLGAVQLPAAQVGGANAYPLHIELRGRRNAGGAPTADLDFVQLTPLYGFRLLKEIGYGAAQNVTLHDNTIDDALYTSGWATAGRLGNYLGQGAPIMLTPDRINSIYFLCRPVSAARTFSVKAFYRSRRLAI